MFQISFLCQIIEKKKKKMGFDSNQLKILKYARIICSSITIVFILIMMIVIILFKVKK